MSFSYAPSSPAEAPFMGLFSNSTRHGNNPGSVSFRNPAKARRTAPIQASYAPAKTKETLYDLLGITETECTLTDIKKAYKQMVRKYHPDVSPPDQVGENTKKFIAVQKAYKTLSDPITKATYDKHLSNGSDSAYSATSKSNQSSEGNDLAEEWRRRWHAQLDELLRRSNGRRERMTWGAQMRNGSWSS